MIGNKKRVIIELQKALDCENCGLNLWHQTLSGNTIECLEGKVHVYKKAKNENCF